MTAATLLGGVRDYVAVYRARWLLPTCACDGREMVLTGSATDATVTVFLPSVNSGNAVWRIRVRWKRYKYTRVKVCAAC